LPNDPNTTGMTKPKIMTNPWHVTKTEYNWKSPKQTLNETKLTSNRMQTEKTKPKNPAKTENKKYQMPMTRWETEEMRKRMTDI